MYEELVKRLRDRARCENEYYDHGGDVIKKAADAIEELATKLATLQDSCKWIPVTERIPEEAGKYLVCGRWRGRQTKIWVCEFVISGCLKGWVNNVAYPSVSHWMPIPEPPKEG